MMGSQRLMSLCLATLALCLVAGCGGGISASSLPVRRVASRDAAIRGLRFHHLPVVRLVSAGALQKLEQKHQQRLIATLPPAKRAQLARSDKDAQAGAEAAYLIGLLDPGEHPTASPSGPAALEGLYDETTHQIFLVKDSVKSKTKAESVLSHELDHALDEQHFGLGTLIGDAASDAPVAELAVREGVATLTELIYGRRYLHRPSAANEIAHFRRPPGPNTKLAREEASGLAFVYGAGTRFVYSLYNRAHGWALVNRALEHPPTTAAEILHPELYLSGVRARTPAGTAGPYLGKPWHRGCGRRRGGRLRGATRARRDAHPIGGRRTRLDRRALRTLGEGAGAVRLSPTLSRRGDLADHRPVANAGAAREGDLAASGIREARPEGAQRCRSGLGHPRRRRSCVRRQPKHADAGVRAGPRTRPEDRSGRADAGNAALGRNAPT